MGKLAGPPPISPILVCPSSTRCSVALRAPWTLSMKIDQALQHSAAAITRGSRFSMSAVHRVREGQAASIHRPESQSPETDRRRLPDRRPVKRSGRLGNATRPPQPSPNQGGETFESPLMARLSVVAETPERSATSSTVTRAITRLKTVDPRPSRRLAEDQGDRDQQNQVTDCSYQQLGRLSPPSDTPDCQHHP